MNWEQFQFDPQYERAAHLIMYYFSHPDLLKLCRMYLTPKVHKNPLGWREICANPQWITSIASYSVHIMLYPLLIKLPSYIESSTELICHIQNSTFNDECVLLQADIENMYPSIDTHDGLSTLHEILEIDNTYNKHQRDIIINLTEWVLTNNYMTFDDQVYKQLNGTSMGTSLSVTYACLYIGHKEKQAISLFKYRKFNDPLLYKRLIDDCAGIFSNHNHAQFFMQMMEHVTNDKIKFEYKISDTELIFLDMNIYKDKYFKTNNTLSTKLFQKENNKYLFIPPFSSHSPSIYKAWITDYIIRIRILCSHDEDYQQYKQLFYIRLIERGYTPKFLNKIFEKQHNRLQIINKIITKYQLKKETRYKTKSIKPFMRIPYDIRTKMLKNKIKQCLKPDNNIKQDIHYKHMFPTDNIQINLITNKSLSQYLTQSK
jgi:hypothetical protein